MTFRSRLLPNAYKEKKPTPPPSEAAIHTIARRGVEDAQRRGSAEITLRDHRITIDDTDAIADVVARVKRELGIQ